MAQGFRSDLRVLPLRRTRAEAMRALTLLAGVFVAGFLGQQLYLDGRGVKPIAEFSNGATALTAETPHAIPPDATVDIVTTNGDVYLNPAAQAYVFSDVMSDARRVVLRLPVQIADLLDPAEPMPSPELAQTLAVARADRLANGECARLMQRIAAECVLAQARVESGTSPEQALMVLTLHFTPLRATGQLPETEQMQFVTSTLRAEPMPDGLAERIAADETGGMYRDYLYADAEAACAQMRRSVGNCSILRIEADLSGDMTDSNFTIAWMEPLHVSAEGTPSKPAG